MSQAIYYIKKNDVNQNSIAQKNEALIHRIPKQALNIPIDDVLNKETLLNGLATAANFPSYFTHNWDSAWDCLTDSDITHLTLYLNGIEKINSEDFNAFKRLIEDAYKDFGKPQLWIIEASDDTYA